MFSSSSNKKETPEAITTILGEGTEVTGDLVFKGSMRIDGQFDGNLTGDHLIISASGKVVGDVSAKSCICHGQVTGNLSVDELQVKKGGNVDGTITTKDLSVESGAFLDGEVKLKKKELHVVDDKSKAAKDKGSVAK
ncbi:polymer-forming cytoskeletal protein [Desulfuromonas acetoxidans]|uniref:bactofilin family protein n=1 Tax=Desulfuromonas acetoxidans TaxID=891 RepID=UPI002930B073|nr:polymer-forming cytoskeletal protein [Desulfuromonas acetoxidans]